MARNRKGRVRGIYALKRIIHTPNRKGRVRGIYALKRIIHTPNRKGRVRQNGRSSGSV